MQVIAFYTKNTPYENEVEIWKESFKECPSKIYPIENKGSWELNCAMKPKVILSALREFDDSILYVDIDARLQRPLESIEPSELPGFCFINSTKVPPFNRQLASGTIYFPQKPNSYKILLDWIDFQEQNPTMWDQVTLQHIVESNKYKYQILAPEWIAISKIAEIKNPIIYHTQASRRLKKEING